MTTNHEKLFDTQREAIYFIMHAMVNAAYYGINADGKHIVRWSVE